MLLLVAFGCWRCRCGSWFLFLQEEVDLFVLDFLLRIPEFFKAFATFHNFKRNFRINRQDKKEVYFLNYLYEI